MTVIANLKTVTTFTASGGIDGERILPHDLRCHRYCATVLPSSSPVSVPKSGLKASHSPPVVLLIPDQGDDAAIFTPRIDALIARGADVVVLESPWSVCEQWGGDPLIRGFAIARDIANTIAYCGAWYPETKGLTSHTLVKSPDREVRVVCSGLGASATILALLAASHSRITLDGYSMPRQLQVVALSPTCLPLPERGVSHWHNLLSLNRWGMLPQLKQPASKRTVLKQFSADMLRALQWGDNTDILIKEGSQVLPINVAAWSLDIIAASGLATADHHTDHHTDKNIFKNLAKRWGEACRLQLIPHQRPFAIREQEGWLYAESALRLP